MSEETTDDFNDYKEYKAGLQEFVKIGGAKDNNALVLFMNFGKDCSVKTTHIKKVIKSKKQIKKDMPKDISISSDIASPHKNSQEESPSEYNDIND